MAIPLSRLLVGRSIPNRDAEGERIGVLEGVAAMGLDGLGSAAYGPEAALTILVAAGAAGLGAMLPITLAILLLLAMLYFSYRQTIAAYPGNGGSYIVAKENLGTSAGLLAASALMLDYTLNVAVGISAGVGALTSALPVLHPYTLLLCLAILVAITLINLRGTRESGLALSVPTYVFIVSLGGILVVGIAKIWLAGGHPRSALPPAPIPPGSGVLTVWLILRAFASGCTAMTGVEAVSNGVSAFREPRVRKAHGTLTVIVVVLGLLLLGIGEVTHAYAIGAMDQTKPGYQSVLSQVVGAVYGRGLVYYVTIASILAVLCLSANTSFVGFPRLCHLVAIDGFLPRPFAVPGRRLVYSVGILFLAAGSGCLLAAFGGITDRLIPLFAVGAFLSFTMSQAGMAAHWRRAIGKNGAPIAKQAGRFRHSPSAHRARLLINSAGAAATGAALVIILLAKFVEGAWLTIIVIPCTLGLLRAVHRYYEGIDRQVLRGSHRRISLRDHGSPAVIVPIKRWDRLSRKAIEHALRLSSDVTALHVTTLEGTEADHEARRLRREWHDLVQKPAIEAGLPPPKLLLIASQYRSLLAPLLQAVRDAQARSPGCSVIVVLPELIEGRWWGYLMHAHRERRLRAKLQRHGGPDVTVLSVPWQLRRSDPDQGLAEETA